LLGSFAAPDLRCNLYTENGTNTWNGPILLDNGDGVLALAANATNAQLNINGPITSPGFIGKLTLRGTGGRGGLNGPVNLPFGQVNKTDNSVWTISSTGNAWASTDVAGGTLRLGANNALPSGVTVNLLGGALDLAGFNQQIAGLNGANAGSVIGSSSTSADCVLTLNTTGTWTNGGIIQDTLTGGTRKVGLTLAGGSLTLTNVNSYSGKTIVSAGTLALAGAGTIANSSLIYLGPGATLDVSARTGAGLALGANQTLQGDGAFSILGNLTNAGTIELKVSKTGAVLACDQLQSSSQITYGGTLKLDGSGDALVAGDAFKLFNAASYAGSFATVSPATPGPGLAWYTGTLATDGTLRVISIPHFVSTSSTFSASESTMTVSGSGGPPLLSFVVLTTGQGITNPVALWTPLQTNTFDANGNCTLSLPLRTNRVQQYFRIRIP
ncbi:MAG TPA: autotransporter-associated beta strand repeat-containing protein, partial [Bacillota bacterium]|nr:autotransporter-associated beta strand repeat-containing protein [Bacillota bacterium]